MKPTLDNIDLITDEELEELLEKFSQYRQELVRYLGTIEDHCRAQLQLRKLLRNSAGKN